MNSISTELPRGVSLHPLKIFKGDLGSVMHVLKSSENSFTQFGEVYFSTIFPGVIKGWRKHLRMVMNLAVPVGEVEFIFYDDRDESITQNKFHSVRLSPENYQRLTVQPGIWMAFRGIGPDESMVVNCASLEYDPDESIVEPFATTTVVPQFFDRT